jgi:hypothetical protein
MQNKRLLSYIFFVIALVATTLAQGAPIDPLSIYLTLEGDPTTTMTVRWVTSGDAADDTLQYCESGTLGWKNTEGSHIPMPNKQPYLIHRVELTGLSPDSDYFFRLGAEEPAFKFRTLPNTLNQPIRFVVGGDMYHDDLEPFAAMNKTVASTNPMFVVLGGDIAYASPKLSLFNEDYNRWYTWLKTWKETMISPDGRMIPFLIAIGNHEVIGRYNQTPDRAKFFYALFKRPKLSGYQAVDFGNYMSVVILDSDITHPIDGEQKEWLKQILFARRSIPHKFAAYHVPAYPSVRKFTGTVSKRVRDHWVPLFEEYGVNAVFEHHDHTYKRTHPLYRGKVDNQRGILYLGDGAWGVGKPREPKSPDQRWYLAKTKASNNVILVILYGDERHYIAIDTQGNTVDCTTN